MSRRVAGRSQPWTEGVWKAAALENTLAAVQRGAHLLEKRERAELRWDRAFQLVDCKRPVAGARGARAYGVREVSRAHQTSRRRTGSWVGEQSEGPDVQPCGAQEHQSRARAEASRDRAAQLAFIEIPTR